MSEEQQIDSAFDYLVKLAETPEEAKALNKMLLKWGAGDPNGFPAQLALLTRLSWKAQGKILSDMEEHRQAMAEQSKVLIEQIVKEVVAAMPKNAVVSTQDEATTINPEAGKTMVEAIVNSVEPENLALMIQSRIKVPLDEASKDVSTRIKEAANKISEIDEAVNQLKKNLAEASASATALIAKLVLEVQQVPKSVRFQYGASCVIAGIIVGFLFREWLK